MNEAPEVEDWVMGQGEMSRHGIPKVIMIPTICLVPNTISALAAPALKKKIDEEIPKAKNSATDDNKTNHQRGSVRRSNKRHCQSNPVKEAASRPAAASAKVGPFAFETALSSLHNSVTNIHYAQPPKKTHRTMKKESSHARNEVNVIKRKRNIAGCSLSSRTDSVLNPVSRETFVEHYDSSLSFPGARVPLLPGISPTRKPTRRANKKIESAPRISDAT
jgi:hypothetical protein